MELFIGGFLINLVIGWVVCHGIDVLAEEYRGRNVGMMYWIEKFPTGPVSGRILCFTVWPIWVIWVVRLMLSNPYPPESEVGIYKPPDMPPFVMVNAVTNAAFQFTEDQMESLEMISHYKCGDTITLGGYADKSLNDRYVFLFIERRGQSATIYVKRESEMTKEDYERYRFL